MFKQDALPGGNVFALFVLVVSAMLGGFLVSLVKLPPLLGMLIMVSCACFLYPGITNSRAESSIRLDHFDGMECKRN